MLQNLIRQIDTEKNRSLFLFIFLFTWFIFNIIQSAFTELAHDEAYYWMYSRDLAWGYFDHPPAIALLIRAGYFLFPSVVGVRLFTALLGTGTILIIYWLIDVPKKSLFLFILIVYSILLIHSHVGGFLAIPDIPVLFFASLFLLVYKYYFEKDSYLLAVVLATVATLMLYSKYHGILILVFTFLANISILRRKSFWVIPFIIMVLLIPHLLWQINNGFPTFQYHLVGRSSSYQLEHTLNFLYSQVLIAGPLVSVIIFYHAFRYRSNSVYDRVMKVNFIGIFIFFFLSSFKGHVEAHWTAIAYIPLVFLVYKGSMESVNTLYWLKILFLPSILFFFVIRVLLIGDIINNKPGVLKEFHGWPEWTKQIDSLAQGRNVVFVNSFQRPSKYTFYSHGKFACSLNNTRYRKNQFDIWNFEDSLQHRPAFLVNSRQPDDTLVTIIGEIYPYQVVDDFVSYNNFSIEVQKKTFNVKPNEIITTQLTLKNPRDSSIKFRPGDRIVAGYFLGNKISRIRGILDLHTKMIDAHGAISFTVSIPAPDEIGSYDLYISIATANLFAAINGPAVKVKVK